MSAGRWTPFSFQSVEPGICSAGPCGFGNGRGRIDIIFCNGDHFTEDGRMKVQEDTTEKVVKCLCDSVREVLKISTASQIYISPMLQRISTVSLRPDIGCFVQFAGDFSGLVVMNFSGDAGLEIYQRYMRNMGMPEEELACQHTADAVADSLGELINQFIGRFRVLLEKSYRIGIQHNQPKAVTISDRIVVSIAAAILQPQNLRVSCRTQDRHRFNMEISMEKIEFCPMEGFEAGGSVNPDELFGL
jgi:CheY-specific phosphatase CheX